MTEFPTGRRYFYLEEIGEPGDDTLRLVIVEASSQGAETEIPGTSVNGRIIAPSPDTRPIALIWDSYIAYAVRNESYSTPEEGNPPLENMLTERLQSAFLSFVAQSTLATSEYPGPYKHWELVCLNHVVDIASMDAPTIRLL